MEEKDSKYFRDVQIIAIVMVLLIHAKIFQYYPIKELSSSYGILEYILVEIVARIAVPIFFVLSGVFSKLIDFNSSLYIGHLNNILQRLVVPYFFWCILNTVIRLVFADETFSWQFLLKTCVNPIPYQLWYVQTLVILKLCDPLINKIIDSKFFLLVVVIIFFFISNLTTQPEIAPLLYYVLGKMYSKDRIILPNALITLSGILLLGGLQFYSYNINNLIAVVLIHKLYLISFIFFILKVRFQVGIGYVYRKPALVFFIYCFHEPLMSFMKSRLLTLGLPVEVVFFGAVIFTFLVSILVFEYMVSRYSLFKKVLGDR